MTSTDPYPTAPGDVVSDMDPAAVAAEPTDAEFDNELDTVFKRRVAVSVALIALLGGLIGFAAADAGARQATVGREAQRSSVLALADQNSAQDAFYEDAANYMEVSTITRRGDIAEITAELLGDAKAAADAKTWRAAAAKVSDVSKVLTDPAYERRHDRLWDQLMEGPNAATLRQQAAQLHAGSWGDKSDLYVGVVTLLAVALTLLGLALTVAPGVRRYLIWPAVVIVTACTATSVVVAVRPADRVPEAAIAAVIAGDHAAARRDFLQAVADYSRAIAAYGDYAVAYQRRAQARQLADSPEGQTSTFVFSASSKQAREAAAADLLRAVELGGDDFTTTAGLGAIYFHLEDYRRSEDYSRQAISRNANLPIPWINLTLALLGQHREGAAADALRRGLEVTRARPYVEERRETFASMRATLETLAGQQSDLEPAVRRLQAMTVAAQAEMEAPGAAVAAPSAEISGLGATSAGSILTVHYQLRHIPRGARVSVVVNHRGDGVQGWSELANQSVHLVWNADESAQFLPYQVTLFMSGCRTSGEYRVSFYADGRLLGATTAGQEQSPLTMKPYGDWVGGIELCQPDTWQLTDTVSGAVDLSAPDRLRRLSVRSVPLTSGYRTEAEREQLAGKVADRLIKAMSAQAIVTGTAAQQINSLPGTARFVRVSPTEDGVVWVSVAADGMLRTVAGRMPTGAAGELSQVMTRLRFVY
ncbi:hypothetical protein QEZ54_10225 [Catellatospora sp. KI3]|uniref:tetratricopeptide repeat protein n=1 Tax=Catellatospora sp. KI3 TaxID=3041620 RepID=UPI0024827C0E|nr:hypothetical protein [Catellatospora sp. KI3]MDI1461344.1 hypothetical protein [Catellatospora sp. KI3]